MEDYNFWADLLDTFQSSPDWIKALWLLIPPAFVLALIWLIRQRAWRAIDGELLYTVYKEPDGLIQIYRHGVLDDGILELLLEQQAERDHGDFHTRESVAGERGAPPFLGPRVSR